MLQNTSYRNLKSVIKIPVAPEAQMKASAMFLFVLNESCLQRMIYAKGFLLVFSSMEGNALPMPYIVCLLM